MGKIIFLVDMNAFFISCEMTRNPLLVENPSAVAGDPQTRTGIILAANYTAREFGIKTAMPLYQALKLCPKLVVVPPDHDFYRKKSADIMSLLYSFSPIVEQSSIDEAWLEMTGTQGLFGTPLEAARKIMDKIKNTTGLWCSIGISENKFLSKMASEMKKPLGITELWQKDVESKLWHLPIAAMHGIGERTAKKLYSLGINTIGDLAKYEPMSLCQKLGKSALSLHLHANGIDESPVVSRSDNDIKSISRSITLPEDLTDLDKAKLILLELSDEIATTAKKLNKKGTTVQITLKYNDFTSITRQVPTSQTYLRKQIYSAGSELLSTVWNSNKPVRLLGICLTGFSTNTQCKQLSIFDFSEIQNTDCNEKTEILEKTIDSIRNKYGYDKIGISVLMKKKKGN